MVAVLSDRRWEGVGARGPEWPGQEEEEAEAEWVEDREEEVETECGAEPG